MAEEKETAAPEDAEAGVEAPLGVIRRLARRASVKKYVEALQPFAITFQDLSVYVPRENGCCADTTGSLLSCITKPFQHCMTDNLGWAVEQTDPYYALQETTGYVQSG